MIKYRSSLIKQSIKIPVKLVCDKCNREWNIDESTKRNDIDYLEVQEFLHINYTGGYSSVFGDGSIIQCDLCQDCVKLLMSDIIRIDGITIPQQLKDKAIETGDSLKNNNPLNNDIFKKGV